MIDIGFSPSPASKISLQSKDNPKAFPKFSKNEIVAGKVIKSLSLKDVILLINGRKVMARTHAPLEEGRVLSLKVEEVLPVPVLKLMGTKFASSDVINIPVLLSAMKENLWQSMFEGINELGLPKGDAALFKALLNDLSQQLFLKSSPDLLKTFIEKSGMSWEAKLGKLCLQKMTSKDSVDKLIPDDLKGLSSKFLAINEDKEALLSRFVSTLKNIQLLNHIGLEQERKIFLPLPFQLPDGFFGVGQLLIHLNQKKNDEREKNGNEKNLFHITFLLELSDLGQLRADLNIKGKEIDANFYLTKEDTRLLLEKNIPSLINNLKEKGFSFRRMAFHMKEIEILENALIKEIFKKEGSSVSWVA